MFHVEHGGEPRMAAMEERSCGRCGTCRACDYSLEVGTVARPKHPCRTPGARHPGAVGAGSDPRVHAGKTRQFATAVPIRGSRWNDGREPLMAVMEGGFVRPLRDLSAGPFSIRGSRNGRSHARSILARRQGPVIRGPWRPAVILMFNAARRSLTGVRTHKGEWIVSFLGGIGSGRSSARPGHPVSFEDSQPVFHVERRPELAGRPRVKD